MGKSLLGLAILLLVAVSTGGAAPVQPAAHKRGDAVVQVQLDRSEVDLAGTVVVTVTIEGSEPLQVSALDPVTPSPDWKIRSASAIERTPLAGKKRVRWRQRFTLEPLAEAGGLALPVGPIRFQSGKAEWVVDEWEPLSVKVQANLTTASLADLADISSIENPARPPERPPWVLYTCLAVGGVSLGLLGAWRLTRRPKSSGELPADEWALRELVRINALGLPAADQGERHLTLVSDVLRRFYKLRLGLNVTEQTTAEFLGQLTQSAILSADQQAALRDFLAHCDLAKFARIAFSADDCQALTRQACDLVVQAGPKPERKA